VVHCNFIISSPDVMFSFKLAMVRSNAATTGVL